MKTFNLFTMGYILSALVLTACENNMQNAYQKPSEIDIKTDYADSCFQLLSFTVTARHWKRISGTDRYVQINLPAITDSIIKEGSVIMYLNEADKNISLPFTYYQVRRALSFQPSYEKGRAYINILGNFILSVRDFYTFRILIVNEKGLRHFKDLNWYNYEEVKRVLTPGNLN